MLTKNSMGSLSKTILSVRANIPVNRLIVVDGGSSDGTVEFISKQRDAILVDDSGGNRATARQRGIDEVETELFAFVDSDMILQKNWFIEARKSFELPDVGAVSTYPKYFGTAGKVQKALEIMYGRPTRRRFDTAAALLRTEAVEGISIPNEDEDIPSEDEFIGREVLKRGYKVLCVGSPVAYHQESPHSPNLMAKGGLLRSEGWRTTRDMLREFVLLIPECLFILFFTGNFSAGWQRIRTKGLVLLGFLLSVRPRAPLD
jgi:GT2 family glycosyltransferase